jgi:hypothetical protein
VKGPKGSGRWLYGPKTLKSGKSFLRRRGKWKRWLPSWRNDRIHHISAAGVLIHSLASRPRGERELAHGVKDALPDRATLNVASGERVISASSSHQSGFLPMPFQQEIGRAPVVRHRTMRGRYRRTMMQAIRCEQ